MELPGIDIRPIREITGDSLFCEVFFDDAKIPVGDRLGDEGNGWLVSMGALGQERVGSAGQAISMAQDLRTLLQTAKAENPDALRDPAIRERVAKLHIQIEATRLLDRACVVEGVEGREGLARGAARQVAVGLHLVVARRTRARHPRPDRRAAEGCARRDRRRPVGAELRVAALHDDRRRPHRGPEEHHRRPRAEARALTVSHDQAYPPELCDSVGGEPIRGERREVERGVFAERDVGNERAGHRAEQQSVRAVAGAHEEPVMTREARR